jgi:transposase InsO family protein
VEEYLEEEGIKHEFSAPYTPRQNGVVERKNQTLIDMVRTMLGEYKTSGAILVRRRKYGYDLPCHKLSISSSPPQEYDI